MKSEKIPTSKSCKLRVGITMGDPSGIGPEITVKALSRIKGLADFIIIGDRWVLEKAGKPRFTTRASGSTQLIDLSNVRHKNFSFGKVALAYGRASIEYLDRALELIKIKAIDCLVTCPISKEAINLAGFHYSGHTEYFAKCTGARFLVMMLLNKFLRFSLVTRHIPLKEVASQLKQNEISQTAILTHRSLRELFLIQNPRMVVCGLNPHASDNGLIGSEENKIIRPALEQIKRTIGHISGPEPADTAIAKARQKKYDAVIAMYHDQALIALKLSDASSGVNLTLGLPFIRTSPLHGTAFDIAGTGCADASSLEAAIKVAIQCRLNLRKA